VIRFALLGLALLCAAPARARTATDAVKSANDKLRDALDVFVKAKGDERKTARDQVRAAVDSLLDFDELVEGAAGRHWKEMSPEQRTRFRDALRGVMEANYLVKGQAEAGGVDLSKVRSDYLGEEKQDNGTVRVKTRLHAGDDSAEVDYVLKRKKGIWHAVDVVTEGASLVETYREQIDTLWPKKQYEGVVSTLERKRKQLEARLDKTE